jgi:D-3-phosphoglycerate dehydrogenase
MKSALVTASELTLTPRPAGLPAHFVVVRTDAPSRMPHTDAQLRAWGGTLHVLPDGVPEQMLLDAVRDADLLLTCYARITRSVIEAAPRLKAIVKYGVGIDAIDIDAARACGVPVVNVPAYAEETVAEHAFALLLALSRRFKAVQRAMDRDGWIWPQPQWLGTDLAGKTLGIVGLGRIGRALARRAAAFDMTVLAWSPRLAEAAHTETGALPCRTLDELLERSDAVSLHCVLNAETRHLIGAAQFARMKPGAVLVNVARGEIVDEAALLAALHGGRLAGAALDVFAQEPLARTGHTLSPLHDMDNVILTPHLAFYSHEAMRRLEDETLARCVEALRGEPLTVHSHDPRLRAQTPGVRFVEPG